MGSRDFAAGLVAAITFLGACASPEPSTSISESVSPPPLIETEPEPRGPNAGCAPAGPFEVVLRVDRSAGYPVIVAEGLTNEFPGGFPPVVWPFGFMAKLEGSVGRIVAPNGQTFVTGQRLALVGTWDQDRFWVCEVSVVDGS